MPGRKTSCFLPASGGCTALIIVCYFQQILRSNPQGGEDAPQEKHVALSDGRGLEAWFNGQHNRCGCLAPVKGLETHTTNAPAPLVSATDASRTVCSSSFEQDATATTKKVAISCDGMCIAYTHAYVIS